MRYGYARVSKDDQNLDLQIEALTRAKCDRIVREKISGKSEQRPVLRKLVTALGNNDVLIVWRVDRLGRHLPSLVALEDKLFRKAVPILSLTEAVDTSTKQGRVIFWFLAIFAHVEHDGIIARTVAGLATARAAGKRFGRRPKLAGAKLRRAIKAVEGGDSVPDVATRFGVSRSTLYRHAANARHTSTRSASD